MRARFILSALTITHRNTRRISPNKVGAGFSPSHLSSPEEWGFKQFHGDIANKNTGRSTGLQPGECAGSVLRASALGRRF
jgi:hypothetical protein